MANLEEHLKDRVEPPPESDTEVVAVTAQTSIAALAEEWLENVEVGDFSESTKHTYTREAKRVVSELGEAPVGEMTVARCRNYLRGIAETHPSKAKIQRTVLGMILDVGLAHDAITHNPVRSVRGIRRPEKKEVEALTEDDLRVLREKVRVYADDLERNHKSGPRPQRLLPDVVDVCVGTGCRIGEALALRWEDVDLDARTVTIRGTIISTKAQTAYRKPKPKSASGYRTLLIPNFLVDSLMRRKVNQGENPLDAVFPTRNATWPSTNNVHGAFRRFREAQDVDPAVTFRSFRKAVATILDREFGVEQAQAQLGHAHSSTTQAHYVAKPALAPDSSELLDGLFGAQ